MKYSLFILIFILSSCSSTVHLPTLITCREESVAIRSLLEFPTPNYIFKIDTLVSQKLSSSSIKSANAIGILDEVENLLRLVEIPKNIQTLENRIQILELSQKISQKIDIASLEISSVASELDCNEERINQLAEYMSNKQANTETNLTIATVLTGAIGAISSGIVLSSPKVSSNLEYVGIASGILEAALGVMILNNKRKSKLTHEENVLQEIWEGKQSKNSPFPPFVWYFLNYEDPQLTGDQSIRSQLTKQWKNYYQIDVNDVAAIQKYFGSGGKYDTDELLVRAGMYDQLESSIKLIKQDLSTLAVELDKIK